MKVWLKDLNMEEFQFQHSPEATIQDVRVFAAEKLQCKPTKLNVRKHGRGAMYANEKTFQQLGLDEKDILIVSKTKKSGIIGQNKACTTSHINHVMNHAQKAHEENIDHHDATHEQLENMNEKVVNMMSKKLLAIDAAR